MGSWGFWPDRQSRVQNESDGDKRRQQKCEYQTTKAHFGRRRVDTLQARRDHKWGHRQEIKGGILDPDRRPPDRFNAKLADRPAKQDALLGQSVSLGEIWRCSALPKLPSAKRDGQGQCKYQNRSAGRSSRRATTKAASQPPRIAMPICASRWRTRLRSIRQ